MVDYNQMSKKQFLATLTRLYRVGNISDHKDNPNNWTKPVMSGRGLCSKLDEIMRGLVFEDVLTEEECQAFYDRI